MRSYPCRDELLPENFDDTEDESRAISHALPEAIMSLSPSGCQDSDFALFTPVMKGDLRFLFGKIDAGTLTCQLY